ncbi:DUF2490 domain-containing protein [Mesonia sp. K7]|uniref:DUF2490 domain-containing protein n=1 Tax=Mesonia sp. K7 TaxID=2218606 RepID=UPI000DA8F7A9|nr:DUF2490 domain-containing protein [Mesonia sp. K7]PZD77755.1 hypothetical protein DNG35_07925 [Mesonia sp. K7]
MKSFLNIRVGLILLFVVAISQLSSAQEELTIFTNEEVSFKLKGKNDWGYQFGLHHRNTIYDEEESTFLGNFIEVNHYTSKKIGENGKLAGGFRYRFQKIFDEEAHEEMRFIQQYSHIKPLSTGRLNFRVRLAQRFREKITFRSRYRIGYELPLKTIEENSNQKQIFYLVNTEMVWEFGKNELPSFGHRFTTGVAFEVFNNAKLTITGEYRHRNYTQNPYTEIHFNTGLSFSL